MTFLDIKNISKAFFKSHLKILLPMYKAFTCHQLFTVVWDESGLSLENKLQGMHSKTGQITMARPIQNVLKQNDVALAGVAQWLKRWPAQQRVQVLIPSQGHVLPHQGWGWGQEATSGCVSLATMFLSLPTMFLSFAKKSKEYPRVRI